MQKLLEMKENIGKYYMGKNSECIFYPCHDGLEDCSFCYCILYPCEIKELGKYITNTKSKKVWDCSYCTLLHKKENIEKIRKIVKDLVVYDILKIERRNNG